MVKKAADSSADEVVLDLEDAVAKEKKIEARSQVVDALNQYDWCADTVSVRVNALDTEFAYGDVIALVEKAGEALGTITVPKATNAGDIRWFDTLLTQLEERHSIKNRIGLDIIIEETEALQNVDSIANASSRAVSLIFGTGDFSASLGIIQPAARPGYTSKYPGDSWHYARARVATAAKSNDLLVLEGLIPDYQDLNGLRERCEWVKELGYDGYQAIHPDQVEIINEVFTPDEDDVEYANRVISLLAESEEDGAGAVSMDGIMIDEAHRRHAEKILSYHEDFNTSDE